MRLFRLTGFTRAIRPLMLVLILSACGPGLDLDRTSIKGGLPSAPAAPGTPGWIPPSPVSITQAYKRIPYTFDMKTVGGMTLLATEEGIFRVDSSNVIQPPLTTANGLPSNQVLKIAVDEEFGYLYALTSAGLAISTDNGFTFGAVDTSSLGNVELWSVYVDSNHVLYLCTDNGLALSTNLGLDFTNTLPGNPVTDVFMNPAGMIYALSGGEVFLSTDNGVSFQNMGLSSILQMTGDETHLALVTETSVVIYITELNNGEINTSFPPTTISTPSGSQMYFDNANSLLWYTDGTHLFQSVDWGATHIEKAWSGGEITSLSGSTGILLACTGNSVWVGDSYGTGFELLGDGVPWSFIQDIGQDAQLFWAATKSGLALSQNGGQSFVTRFDGKRVASASRVENYLYAVLTENSSGNGLYRSSDNGGTFQQVLSSNTLTVVRSHNHFVYLGSEEGLSVSSDFGDTFTTRDASNGLSGGTVFDIFIQGSKMYVVTEQGISISDDSGTTFTTRDASSGIMGEPIKIYVYVDGSIYLTTSAGIAISHDGDTFTSIPAQNMTGLTGSPTFILKLDGVLYVSTEIGLFASIDDGAHFSEVALTGIGGSRGTVSRLFEYAGKLWVGIDDTGLFSN